MMEPLQTGLQVALKQFQHLPVPWQFLWFLCILIFLTIFIPWLILRGLPWVLPKISRIMLVIINFLVVLLLWPESLISQHLRQRGLEPPSIFYLYGNLLNSIVNLFELIAQSFDGVSSYLLKRRWLLSRRSFLAISAIFLLVWGSLFILAEIKLIKVTKTFVIQAGDGYANLRGHPSTEVASLAKIPNGTPVTILGEKMNSSKQLWYKVQVNDQTGWIYSGLIEQR